MRSLFLIALCALSLTPSFAQTQADDVQSFTLDNGMKVLVLEDHSIPNANMYLFWRVGSRNEYPGITGISHFFEHMMFNGSQQYGPKMFDRTMEAAGGSNNAYTTNDVTVYTDWFPSSGLETIFQLEADRIAHLSIDPDMVESERGVVLSERSTGLENSNYRMLAEQVDAVAFFAHPYKWSVIGYESDIKAWTQEDLERYFKTYYAPNNAVVVVVGDVTVAQVKKLATQYFAPIPAQTPPDSVRTVEPPQNGEKRLLVHKEVSSPNVMIAHHTPAAEDKDYYALELLSSILSSGNSSRMMKNLVFDQPLATSVFTYQPVTFDPNLFVMYGVTAADVTPTQLEEAMLAELDKIKREGITDRELEKVKNQKLMEFYDEIQTINGKANSLGTYELFFGDYRKLFQAPALYQQVTKEDIRRVAQTYFSADNRTVGYLQPKEDDATDE
ncbi:Predicted Zn-dependent peptidase [Catalinimonas alkaloidigena]|uniref:Predicted Zn-dependent peptidase n=1 Tax=Catalinimonas alkaloidigena TaxID=1075417 RepID=A0A1G9IUF4_9BACT|nr:pitrilysin family protein [Catalinimonas alkaloidigena]SDL28434.1 Predicted Zn-dependent peptidase [Catalinimonas alkaloidigena]